MNSTSLFPEPEPTIEPGGDRDRPALWIRRLVVVADRSPSAEVIRDVSFKTGLNVIRVAVRPPDEPRPVGHSVGKTLLARLIRYCLGENHFAAAGVVRLIAERRPNAYVLAEIEVQGQWWVVARPLRDASANESHAVAADDWHAGLGETSGLLRFGDFVDAVVQAIVAPLPALRLPGAAHAARWLDLLAWLARDQECSYQHPNEWRDPEANSGTARLPRDDASLLMRWAMSLLDGTEIEEITRRRGLLEEQSRAADRIKTLTHRIDALQPALAARMGLRAEDLTDAMFLQQADTTATERIESLQRLHKEFVDAAEQSPLRDEATAAAQAVAVAEDRLERTRALHQTAAGELSQCESATQEDYYSSFRRCPLNEPTCPRNPAYRAASLADPQRAARIEELRGVVARHTDEIATLEGQLPTLRRAQSDAKERYASDRRTRQENIAGTLAQKGRWELLREELRELSTAQNDRIGVERRVEALEREVRASRERETADRFERAIILSRLNECFDWTLKRLVGPEAGGGIRLDARGLHPEPATSVAVHGAAIGGLARVIGLDLACLAATVCGVGGLPGFLLHDSPSPTHMEDPLYERIFLLALELERAYGSRPPAFQYIVTTTTPPPGETGDAPFVRLTLDARAEEGLLLGARY